MASGRGQSSWNSVIPAAVCIQPGNAFTLVSMSPSMSRFAT
jgi:hypothetical protein